MIFSREFKSSDLLLAVFIMAVAAMLIVPLPTALLDLLLVINFTVSILLLLSGLYLPHALALLSFPSLLLLTTLFRLALNVASTRLILMQADAGRVIEAFGQYLVQGEVVIGLVIFFILSAVNFVVISKGAARVSEVAARFTLDSLPGRQSSIDSDLRSGLISAEEAQRQRENLSKESQLYGAMDGSMKFVQGDAIVGLIIIFVNLLGGLYIGVRSGMSFSEAVETYSILTVGDGLVNQVPAILIAICAGLVVTRVSERDSASLAEDVRNQVFAKPVFLLFAAFILFFFSFLEGIPSMPFLMVAVFLVFVAYRQSKAGIRQSSSGFISNLNNSISYNYNPSTMQLLPAAEKTILLEVDSARLHPLWVKKSNSFLEWWEFNRFNQASFFGIALPKIKVSAASDLAAGEYSFRFIDSKILASQLTDLTYLVELSPACASFFGISDFRTVEHPLFDKTVICADLSVQQRNFLKIAKVNFYDQFQSIALHLIKYSQLNPQDFYSVSDLIALEARLERSKPGLVNSVLAKQFFTPSRVTEIAFELSRQSVHINDYLTLVELLSKYSATVGATLTAEGEFDLTDIVSFIRLARSRQLAKDSTSLRGKLAVISTDPVIDNEVSSLPRVSLYANKLGDNFNKNILSSLRELIVDFKRHAEVLPVLEVRDDLRPRYHSIIYNCRLPVRVVSSEELANLPGVEHFGVWRLK